MIIPSRNLAFFVLTNLREVLGLHENCSMQTSHGELYCIAQAEYSDYFHLNCFMSQARMPALL